MGTFAASDPYPYWAWRLYRPVTVSVPFTDSGSVTASESRLAFQSPAFTLDAGGSVDDVSGGTIGFTDETLTLGPGLPTGNSFTITSGAITGMTSTGSGELDLAGSLTLAGTNVWSGTLDGSQAALNLTSGSLSLSGTATIGTLGIRGGAVTSMAGTTTVGTLDVGGGTLADAGSLEVTTAWNWSGGSLTGAGQIQIDASADATLSGSLSLGGPALTNDGTVTLYSISLDLAGGSVCTNDGTFTTPSDGSPTTSDSLLSSDGTGSFINVGHLRCLGPVPLLGLGLYRPRHRQRSVHRQRQRDGFRIQARLPVARVHARRRRQRRRC